MRGYSKVLFVFALPYGELTFVILALVSGPQYNFTRKYKFKLCVFQKQNRYFIFNLSMVDIHKYTYINE